MDCVPSAKTTRGPFSSSSACATRRAGPKPSSASEACQTKASSSVISTSAWPSPSRSTNLRFGSRRSRFRREVKGRKGCQPSASSCSYRPGVGPSMTTTSGWPSPARSMNSAPPLSATLGLRATVSSGANCAFTCSRPSGSLSGIGLTVALVEPGAGLLGEDAGDAFAVQVGPAVGAAVQADGKVLEALRIDLLHRVLHDGLGVFELDGRQAALVVAAVVAAIAGLGHRFAGRCRPGCGRRWGRARPSR